MNPQFHSALRDAAQAMRAFGGDAAAGSGVNQPDVLSAMKVDAASFSTALAALRTAGPDASFTPSQQDLYDKMIPLMGDLEGEMKDYIKYAAASNVGSLQPVAVRMGQTVRELEAAINSISAPPSTAASTSTAAPVSAGIADPAKCSDDTAGLRKALNEMNSRLTLGLTFPAYSEQAGNVRVAYDAVPWDTMAADCITGPGVLLEKAVNSYTSAYRVWNTCVQDYGCDSAKIKPRLQKEWARAAAQISSAESDLP